jgi:hypothetical protein
MLWILYCGVWAFIAAKAETDCVRSRIVRVRVRALLIRVFEARS